jgi:hypothetical protein
VPQEQKTQESRGFLQELPMATATTVTAAAMKRSSIGGNQYLDYL